MANLTVSANVDAFMGAANKAAMRTAMDLGTAATTASTAYATAAQGAKADTALQDASAFATSAQGALADSALQPVVDSGYAANSGAPNKNAALNNFANITFSSLDGGTFAIAYPDTAAALQGMSLFLASLGDRFLAINATLVEQKFPDA